MYDERSLAETFTAQCCCGQVIVGAATWSKHVAGGEPDAAGEPACAAVLERVEIHGTIRLNYPMLLPARSAVVSYLQNFGIGAISLPFSARRGRAPHAGAVFNFNTHAPRWAVVVHDLLLPAARRDELVCLCLRDAVTRKAFEALQAISDETPESIALEFLQGRS